MQQQRTAAEARRNPTAGAAPYATVKPRRSNRGDRGSNYGRARSGGGAKHSSGNPPQPTNIHRQTGSSKTPASAAKSRGARNPSLLSVSTPGVRQRQKRQEEISRENERMERRLKIIREAAPPRRDTRRETARKAARSRAGGDPSCPLPEHEQRRRGRGGRRRGRRDDGGLQLQVRPPRDAWAQAKGGPTEDRRESPRATVGSSIVANVSGAPFLAWGSSVSYHTLTQSNRNHRRV